MATQTLSQQKSADRLAFEHYLRTGERLTSAQWLARYESKYNHIHDERGRFAAATGGVAAMGHGAAGGLAAQQARSASQRRIESNGQPRVDPERDSANDIGGLSAKHESSPGGDPGRISTGRNDPGGVSYGSYQLSSRAKRVDAFLASPEALPWAAQFRNLRPATPAFNDHWRAAAAGNPAAFHAAQKAFVGRENYKLTVKSVAHATGYELHNASNAVRQVAWSVAVQHGGARFILGDAVRNTDLSFRRDDQRYQRALINNIYDRRIQYVTVLRDRAIAQSHPGTARTFNNDITGRYPQERVEALQIFDGK